MRKGENWFYITHIEEGVVRQVHKNSYEIEITVTSQNAKAEKAMFTLRVDDNGMLTMTRVPDK